MYIMLLIAPGNNLEASPSIAQAGEEFRQLLLAVKLRWTNVFVLDFPRRIDGKKDQRYQELLALEMLEMFVRLNRPVSPQMDLQKLLSLTLAQQRVIKRMLSVNIRLSSPLTSLLEDQKWLLPLHSVLLPS
ncbi:hypothetical protein UPYG_G00214870 [Umbra pygmaea]|uniref:Uncharacterized protein n=1 Tax=Umbra pygmaea TaxID=75934 RepID=A0ABD0X2N2_UMBPY